MSTAEWPSAFDATPGSTHNLVVGLVSPGARVLEFGCSSGYMSAVFQRQLGCSVTGIEVCADAADEAREYCERVIVGDAEHLDFEELFGGERFDVIVFADVLEHLKQPGQMLRRVAPFLADDGAIVASVPNVAHASVRLALLHGEFAYRASGLLDQTHIRFFTRDSIRDVFESSGYLVTSWLRRHADIGTSEVTVLPSQVAPGVWDKLMADPEATTYQYVLRAVRADSAALVHQLRTEAQEAERAAREWQQRVELQAHEVGDLRALVDAFPSEIQRRDGWIADLKNEVQRLEDRVRALHDDAMQLERVVDERDQQIVARDQQIVALEQEIRQLAELRDRQIDSVQHIVDERDRHIGILQQTVCEHEQHLIAQRDLLDQRDQQIDGLQRALDQRQQQIESIQSSRLWRLAQGYWNARSGLSGSSG